MKAKSLLATAIISGLCFSPLALAKHDHKRDRYNQDKIVQGTYTVSKGAVATFDITTDPTTLEQLGKFEITLENTDWHSLSRDQKRAIKKKVKIKGIVKGTIDLTNLYTVGPVVSHVMTDNERSFVLYSANDVFVPVQGDLYCSTGEPMQIQEYVNLVSATGEFDNLAGGTIVLEGTVNNCPHLADYGKYDLSIVANESAIVFE